MIPASLIESLSEWCIECEDVFIDEDARQCAPGVFPEESCETLGHHRALDPRHDTVWKICDRCRGDGFLRGYPGVYTSDDFAEDPDLMEDYMEHRRACEDCGGSGKIRDFTDEALARPIVQEWLRDHYDMLATMRAEQRMGA